MSRIVFEGTEQEIENLRLLLSHGDNDLPKIVTHYQTENLWSIWDAKAKFDCTDEEAMLVIEKALTNGATMEQIWFAIDVEGECMGLKKLDE